MSIGTASVKGGQYIFISNGGEG